MKTVTADRSWIGHADAIDRFAEQWCKPDFPSSTANGTNSKNCRTGGRESRASGVPRPCDEPDRAPLELDRTDFLPARYAARHGCQAGKPRAHLVYAMKRSLRPPRFARSSNTTKGRDSNRR